MWKREPPIQDLLESFPTLLKVVKCMADSSAESFRMLVRSSALINLARWTLWLNLVRGLGFKCETLRDPLYRGLAVWAGTRDCVEQNGGRK